LPTILSDVHFFLSIYEKISYCTIYTRARAHSHTHTHTHTQDSIIKTLTSSNKKHFLVCISKV